LWVGLGVGGIYVGIVRQLTLEFFFFFKQKTAYEI